MALTHRGGTRTGTSTASRSQAPAPSFLMQSAELISAHLVEIAALLEFSGESRFKVNAYRRAAEVGKTLGNETGPPVEQGRLRKFQGIGQTLSRLIEEMWNSGTPELLMRLRAEQPAGAAELMEVE